MKVKLQHLRTIVDDLCNEIRDEDQSWIYVDIEVVSAEEENTAFMSDAVKFEMDLKRRKKSNYKHKGYVAEENIVAEIFEESEKEHPRVTRNIVRHYKEEKNEDKEEVPF